MAIAILTSNESGANSLIDINANFADITSSLALKSNLASPTFTGTPTLPTGTIATTQGASNNSTKVATTAYVDTAISVAVPDLTSYVQVATVTLSSADILAGFATPKTLLAAPGAGKVIVVENVVVSFTAGTTYANGGIHQFNYNGDTVPLVTRGGGGGIFTSVSSRVDSFIPLSDTVAAGINLTAGTNKAVQWSVASSAYTTGTGTAKIFIKYRTITL